jgi:UDP-glucuronate decarboxylase
MLELAERVINLTGARSKFRFMPLPENDPQQRQPDTRRAGVKLGWRPTVPLDVGLQRTIAYFKGML